VEIMTAVDAGKTIILVNGGNFDLDSKDSEGRVLELYRDVDPEFQPYARALIKVLEVGEWASNPDDRESKMKQIIKKYLNREESSHELRECLAAEKLQPAVLEDSLPESLPASQNAQIAHRATRRRSSVARWHRAHAGGTKRAPIPRTAPDLPCALQSCPLSYVVEPLKVALLRDTEVRQQLKALHGMGGVGKTTAAAAVLNDDEVRERYEQMVWINVGLSPEIPFLQNLIFHQLTGSDFPSECTREHHYAAALDHAAYGSRVLLVLDDVWDASHVKRLNFLDRDTSSKLIVTTQMEKLLQGKSGVESFEMGQLEQAAAISLLEATSGLSSGEGGEFAPRVVELCARLPLTIGIAGGIVAETGEGITSKLVELIADSDLNFCEVEGDQMCMVEDRIINAAVTALCGVETEGSGATSVARHSSSCLSPHSRPQQQDFRRWFEWFSVYPMGVPVPLEVILIVMTALDPDKSDERSAKHRRAILAMRQANLLQGSIAAGDGLSTHSVIHKNITTSLSPADLREMQRKCVEALLAARPAQGYFRSLRGDLVGEGLHKAQHVPSTLQWYVSLHLHHHIMGSLEQGQLPAREWVEHQDWAVKAATATAVGRASLKALAEAEQAKGRKAKAALLSEMAATVSWHELEGMGSMDWGDMEELKPKSEACQRANNQPTKLTNTERLFMQSILHFREFAVDMTFCYWHSIRNKNFLPYLRVNKAGKYWSKRNLTKGFNKWREYSKHNSQRTVTQN